MLSAVYTDKLREGGGNVLHPSASVVCLVELQKWRAGLGFIKWTHVHVHVCVVLSLMLAFLKTSNGSSNTCTFHRWALSPRNRVIFRLIPHDSWHDRASAHKYVSTNYNNNYNIKNTLADALL